MAYVFCTDTASLFLQGGPVVTLLAVGSLLFGYDPYHGILIWSCGCNAAWALGNVLFRAWVMWRD
eukprot:388923-Pyramimonas_sp.AAC.1